MADAPPNGDRDLLLDELLATLAARSRTDGTTLALPGESEPAVEATAWRALALRLAGARADGPAVAAQDALAAGTALVNAQAEDGRLSLSPMHPGAYSPTSIALLAWHGRPEFAAAHARALAFLLGVKGDHFPRDPQSPLGMDTDLAGWPWIERTFSWAEPTALALLALESAGLGGEARAGEGRALLLDRQIASGGWNYGNARVFGSDLRPAPESTGLVLAALAGRVEKHEVKASLAYLSDLVPAMRTPLSLGWGWLAMSAWNERRATDLVAAMRETLARESRYGGYQSAELALLAVAVAAPRGLLAALRESA